jgi:hypothetical protein
LIFNSESDFAVRLELGFHARPKNSPMNPAAMFAFGLALVVTPGLLADISVQVSVDPTNARGPISPYIYGVDQDLPGVAAPGARRYGGNRLTAYNWETNASNAGSDYYYSNDNYLVSGLPADQQGIPAIALTQYHDQSLAMGTPYTVLTLQMAGYVSADEDGGVSPSQYAPSSRFNSVVNNTPGGVFPGAPNLTDGVVHMDELLNLILTKYGSASGATGVKGYNLDNEPDLWSSTHPEVHPAQPTCAEIIGKSVPLAQTIKRMDPAADVLGPVSYGSAGYFTFQGAADWAAIQAANPGYRWFLDYYLDQMSQASAAAGVRLLDVLDLHRYSDETAVGNSSLAMINQTDFTDTATDQERVQDPRILWDPTFVENSWVGQYYPQFVPWIPNIQASINKYYPGTKLSFTEYNYGGESDISGGIAQADVLGIYGKYGVYLGCLWLLHSSPPPLYVSAAFNLYLNYDGNGGKFGSTSLAETDSDTVNTSAYASVDSARLLHVVVLNKSYTQAADVSFQIAGPNTYSNAVVYAFDSSGSAITARAPATIVNGKFSYKLAPLTAAHFVAGGGSAPVLSVQPISQSVSNGSTVVLTALAASATSYQWSFTPTGSTTAQPMSDSALAATHDIVSGSGGPQLVIADISSLSAGTYTVVAVNPFGSSQPSSAATVAVVTSANPGALSSISARAYVGTGSNILIGGFYIVGSTSATVLIQAIGPALAGLGVSGTLQHPALSIHQTQNGKDVVIYSDSGWGSSSVLLQAAAAAYAMPALQPGSADSELLLTLPPGGYTAEVGAADGTSAGVALCAVYQL